MSITFEAVYEDGVLKPNRPLPLKEQEKVTITLEADVSLARQTTGMIGLAGDVEDLRTILHEAEDTPYS